VRLPRFLQTVNACPTQLRVVGVYGLKVNGGGEVMEATQEYQEYIVNVCDLCGKKQGTIRKRCAACNHPSLTETAIPVTEYCVLVGHDGGEMCLPDSARKERVQFVPLVEDGLTIGGRDEDIYSYEYLFSCARCGFEQQTRR